MLDMLENVGRLKQMSLITDLDDQCMDTIKIDDTIILQNLESLERTLVACSTPLRSHKRFL